jgi:hypothetical protein
MKLLRHTFVRGFSIWLVITGLMCLNASIGKLSQYYPNSNISSLLVEEVNKDLEDSSPETGSSADADGDFLDTFDIHASLLFQFCDFAGIYGATLSPIVLLSFGNVHLDRFSPPPEA